MDNKIIQREFSFSDETARRLMSPDEIFDMADHKLLSELKEDRRIERKSTGYSGSELGKDVCMWANTQPDGGLIVLGQRDSGAFEGCIKLPPEAINEREKVGERFCPDATLRTRHVSVTNDDGMDDFVLLMRVDYNKSIVVRTTAGKAYVRKGDSRCELRPEEIRELQADKGEVSFEQQAAALAYPDEFDGDALRGFSERVKSARNLPSHLITEEVLDLRRLGSNQSGSFVPNHACVLLFATDPVRTLPGCKVHFQRFEGNLEGTGDRYNAVKDIILEGTVSSLIEQTESVLQSQLRTFSPLDSSGRFYPVPEYPKDAWYEALVNACVHRSYGNGLRNMPVFVKMFDDRLVVESPGPFPPFVTPDNIYEMHQPRNPALMDAMFYMDYVRCAHEGTRRIKESMAKMGLPLPEFRQTEVGHAIVRVTLKNNIKQRRAWIDHDVSKLVSEAIAADLTEDEKRALNWAAEHGRITISDAQKLLDMSWQKARRLLLELSRKRIFQYIRFREFEFDKRDPKAFFRLRSADPLPDGGFEASELPEG